MSLKVAVTGSSGFIGSYFVDNNKDFEIIHIDLFVTTIDAINFTGYDVVLHLAGIAHKRVKDDQLYYVVNRDLAAQVAQKAKECGVKQFVFMSTAKVYCDCTKDGQVLNEQSDCNPQDAYAKSKYEAEILIRKLEDDHFKIAVIRSPMVYGPGVKANMYNLVKWIYQLPIIPLGGIHNTRSMVYIGNLNYLIRLIILQQASGIFIPGDERNLSTSELCSYIVLGLNKKSKIINIPGFIFKMIKFCKPAIFYKIIGSFALDNTQTQNTLRYYPKFTTEEGVLSMTTWFKQQIKQH